MPAVARSGPRHFASRIERPIAIKADDAPFNSPARPQQAGVFANGIMDGMLEPIADQRHGGAETTWNRVRRPGPIGGLTDHFIAHDGKIRVPEGAFLFGKARADL